MYMLDLHHSNGEFNPFACLRLGGLKVVKITTVHRQLAILTTVCLNNKTRVTF